MRFFWVLAALTLKIKEIYINYVRGFLATDETYSNKEKHYFVSTGIYSEPEPIQSFFHHNQLNTNLL